MSTASEQAPAAQRSVERGADSPLKAERVRQGLTRRELAALAGVSKSTLAGIENGHHRPSVELAGRFAVALDVDLLGVFTLIDCECGKCDEQMVDMPRLGSSARFLSGHNSRLPEHAEAATRAHRARRRRLGIPEEKICARCGETFTRSDVPNQSIAHWIARQYCSGDCRWPVRVEPRPCGWCGVEFKPDEDKHEYCCVSHAQLARFKRGDVAAEFVAEMPGQARRMWKLKWAPRPGRPRNDERLDYDETLEMIRVTYDETHASERELERLTGESRRMVRTALERPH
jgi:DNA-binding XRE family transcriptional regulator